MDSATIIALAIAILIFVVALLYSTVGHAGASGYLAAMALFGMAPIVMKPTALTLNIIVALIGAVRFYRAGFFSWRTFWPFAVASIPASFIGGSLTLPDSIYKSIVGVVLLYSAVRLFFSARVATEDEEATLVPIWIALCLGAAIGLLSGLTGVGGGIFLSPVLLLMRWTTTKETSGVSAAFILVNSVAGLLGHVSAVSFVANDITFWAPAALIGGWIGTELGTRVLPIAGIRRWLSVVLVLAGLKLMSEATLILIRR
ncbi:MAG TPA: sulfite exporter TauE/SafE family protein [Pyrinomonadaceae bacterium]|nr:sulfite exporter TauE/SafE family protein [Pyrinomonadaceae bacterium]